MSYFQTFFPLYNGKITVIWSFSNLCTLIELSITEHDMGKAQNDKFTLF